MSLGRLDHKTKLIQAKLSSNPKCFSNPRRDSRSSSHVGRGGAANVFKPSETEIAAARKDVNKWYNAISDEDELDCEKPEAEKGLADKGKAWLKGKMGKA